MCSSRRLQGCCGFSLDLVILFIPVVIINLTIVQRQIATVLKHVIQSPVRLPAVAVFLVIDCFGAVVDREQHRSPSSRWALRFEGGWLFPWGRFEVQHPGLCSRALLHFVGPGRLVARAFHDDFRTVKHKQCNVDFWIKGDMSIGYVLVLKY